MTCAAQQWRVLVDEFAFSETTARLAFQWYSGGQDRMVQFAEYYDDVSKHTPDIDAEIRARALAAANLQFDDVRSASKFVHGTRLPFAWFSQSGRLGGAELTT